MVLHRVEEDRDIIEIDITYLVNVLSEHSVHELLPHSHCIAQWSDARSRSFLMLRRESTELKNPFLQDFPLSKLNLDLTICSKRSL